MEVPAAAVARAVRVLVALVALGGWGWGWVEWSRVRRGRRRRVEAWRERRGEEEWAQVSRNRREADECDILGWLMEFDNAGDQNSNPSVLYGRYDGSDDNWSGILDF